MNSDSFRLCVQEHMKQARDSIGMLHFDQDHVNPAGCLPLRAAVHGGEGRERGSGKRKPSCAASCNLFPSIKGFNQRAHIVFLLYETIFSEIR